MSIEKRLVASLKHDVMHGDACERTIFAGQVREAVTEIVRLRAEARLLGLVIAECEMTRGIFYRQHLEAFADSNFDADVTYSQMQTAIDNILKLAKGGG